VQDPQRLRDIKRMSKFAMPIHHNAVVPTVCEAVKKEAIKQEQIDLTNK